MEPTNRRRVVRALEVTLGAGPALLRRSGPGSRPTPPSGRPWSGLAVPPDEVDRRIDERFAAMVAAGLVDEVRALAARPGGISRTARQALGYREILAHVEDGAPLEACVDEAVRRTRPVRPPPGVLVPPRPAHHLGGEPGARRADLLERALAVHG